MRTMVPILSVFLLVAVALVGGDLSGSGAVPEREIGEYDITGRASVIDGDTLEIHGQRIRLSGKIISCFGGGICSGGSLGLPSPAPLAC